MFKIFIEGVCCSFAIVILVSFLNDIKIKPKMFIGLLTVYLVLSPSLLIPDPNDNYVGRTIQIIYILCHIFVALIAFGLHKIKSIIYVYLMYIGTMFHLSFLLFSILSLLNINKAVPHLVDICIYVISLMLVLFIYFKRDKYHSVKQITIMPRKLKILSLLCLWSSGLLSAFLRIGIESVEHTKAIIAIFILSIAIIILLGIVFPTAIIYGFSRDKYKMLSKTYETQTRAQEDNYEAMLESTEDIREFRHDFANFQTGLKSLLENKKYDEALNFVNSGREKIDSSNRNPYNTNNHIVDALLYSKLEQAKKSNTIIKFDGILPQKGIDIEDLCIIFGVPLDNAIEACEKLDKDKLKIISVYAQPIKACLCITITNPVVNNVVVKNNQIQTTKSDTLNHGIGLHSLKKSVDKYEGFLDVSCENNKFKVDVTLLSWLK